MLAQNLSGQTTFDEIFSKEAELDTLLTLRRPQYIETQKTVGERELELFMAPFSSDHAQGGVLVVIHDVTEQRRSEQLKREFVANVSHELRTPLTAITGWSETLMFDTAIQGDSRRGIAIISKEAARLTSLVEELLEFTRIQDGRFNLSMELLDIESEFEDTIFTYQELLRQDGIYRRFVTRPRRRSRSCPATRSASSRCFSTSSTTPPNMRATARQSKCPFFRTVKLLPFNSGTMAPASRKTSCRT